MRPSANRKQKMQMELRIMTLHKSAKNLHSDSLWAGRSSADESARSVSQIGGPRFAGFASLATEQYGWYYHSFKAQPARHVPTVNKRIEVYTNYYNQRLPAKPSKDGVLMDVFCEWGYYMGRSVQSTDRRRHPGFQCTGFRLDRVSPSKGGGKRFPKSTSRRSSPS